MKLVIKDLHVCVETKESIENNKREIPILSFADTNKKITLILFTKSFLSSSFLIYFLNHIYLPQKKIALISLIIRYKNLKVL